MRLEKKDAPLEKFCCVRWEDPTDELLGVARCAKFLIWNAQIAPANIAIAVPNYNWAIQARRALEQSQIKSSVCIKIKKLKPEDEKALATLDFLASPEDEQALAHLIEFGYTKDEAQSFAEKYIEARGQSLLKICGISGKAAFFNALLHIEGDEDAKGLRDKIHEQLVNPTLPPESDVCPILELGSPLLQAGHIEWVFAVALLDGFANPAHANEDELATAREKLELTIDASNYKTVGSWFKKIDYKTAELAGLAIARTREEHGQKFAICSQAKVLSLLDTLRPPTTSGVEFYRDLVELVTAQATEAYTKAREDKND